MKLSRRFTLKHVAAACSIAGLAALSGAASASSFFVSSGVTSAQVDFTILSNNSLQVVLTDTANVAPSDRAQLLSDLSFSITGGSSLSNTSVTGTGNLISCTDGTGCTSASGSANAWSFGNNSGIGTGSFLLTGLAGNPKTLIMGSVSPTCTPSKCPDGLGSNPDSPKYFQNSATFSLTIPGITTGSNISNVSFSFGTAPETVLAGTPLPTPVPIPAAAWLFGSGLMGLIAVARRRSKGSGSSPPMPELAAA